jgi:hypothetical protein
MSDIIFIIVLTITILLILLVSSDISDSQQDEHFKILHGAIPNSATINNIPDRSLEQCVNECIKEPECKSASYDEYNQLCMLKSITSPPIVPNYTNGSDDTFRTIVLDKEIGEDTQNFNYYAMRLV